MAPPFWLDEDGRRILMQKCVQPTCDREYPLRRYRYHHLRMSRWELLSRGKLHQLVRGTDRSSLRAVASALGGPASESGRLCHGDAGHEEGARRRRALMLPVLVTTRPLASEMEGSNDRRTKGLASLTRSRVAPLIRASRASM